MRNVCATCQVSTFITYTVYTVPGYHVLFIKFECIREFATYLKDTDTEISFFAENPSCVCCMIRIIIVLACCIFKISHN